MARNNTEMVMSFELLLHGKPNNYDYWGRTSFGGIEEKICREYFDNKDYLPDSGYLVEIRSWQDSFYCIYTYVKKVKDTSKRPSYIALSLIFKGVFCCKSRDIFELLVEIYEKKLIREAKIIGSDNVFCINWFKDSSTSLEPITKITEDCVSSKFCGLFENIDDTFTKRVTPLSSIVKCNPIDCDSEAFFDNLKRYGRILVDSTIPSKDSLLASHISMEEAFKEVKKIADTVPVLEASLEEANVKIHGLLSDKNSLIENKIALEKRIEEDAELIKRLNELLSDKEKEIDFAIEKLRHPIEKIFTKIETSRKEVQSNVKGWLRITPYIPIVNLILLLFLSFVTYQSFSLIKDIIESSPHTTIVTPTPAPINDNLEIRTGSQIETSTVIIHEQESTDSSPVVTEEQIVIDCGLKVEDAFGNTLNNDTQIKSGSILTLSVDKPQKGYSWRISNGEFPASDKSKETFNWIVNCTKTGNVVITYRPDSEEARLNNPNKISLKYTKE